MISLASLQNVQQDRIYRRHLIFEGQQVAHAVGKWRHLHVHKRDQEVVNSISTSIKTDLRSLSNTTKSRTRKRNARYPAAILSPHE